MKKSNVIILISIIIVILYLILKYQQQKEVNIEITDNGSFYIAVISEKRASKSSTRSFKYKFQIIKKKYKTVDFVSVYFYDNNKIGDTIIIKFLKNDPEKCMIIEDREYKSCYGIPPPEGWKSLPECN